jgi:GT2 family glycosyltransferase
VSERPRELSILIVSYNTRELTLECLRSVERETRADHEILVVDNASRDGSADAVRAEFPGVRLFALSENLGFARGNNLAAERASGEWLLLLNPDTVVLDGAIDRLLAFARSRPEAGIFGGRTLRPTGVLDPTSCWARPTPWSMFCRATGLARLFAGGRWFDPEAMGGWQRDTVREVDIVTGCFLLLSRSLWQELGGFDPEFFMYGEEADLCLRAKQRGKASLVCPDATIIHYAGASEQVRADKTVRLFRAKARLIRKHWAPGSRAFGLAMLYLWAWSRMAAFALATRGGAAGESGPREVWRAIWQRRAEWARG